VVFSFPVHYKATLWTCTIRHLSVEDKDKKCPTVYIKGDDCCDEYMEALNNLLGSDAKKIQFKEVVESWCGGDAPANAYWLYI
jgi:hypothetical protein